MKNNKNKSRAGYCFQAIIKRLVVENRFLWRSNGVDGLVKDGDDWLNDDIAAICAKRTLRERSAVELKYKNKWEKNGIFIPFCIITHDRDITQGQVNEIIGEEGFYLFLPDNIMYKFILHPNLHPRSSLLVFLKSLTNNKIAA